MQPSRARTKVTCSHCGGDEFVDGKLYGYAAWGVRFKPTLMRWFRNRPLVEATACRSCGRLSLWVEPDDVRRALREGP